ncbi:MAG: RidA family protein [Chloroflexi bacterium]|nr:RidA family protein [Chloroflexota bacterium]
MTPDERLIELGIELPPPPTLSASVAGRFLIARQSRGFLYISGSGPFRDGELVYQGKVGSDLTLEQGYDAARLTGLLLLATVRDQLGSLDRAAAWVKLLGMVNVAPGFTQTPAVINGCSDLLVEVFGHDRGAHARSAVGLAELPLGMAVEIEAIVEIAD